LSHVTDPDEGSAVLGPRASLPPAASNTADRPVLHLFHATSD
jgi:hypothetical protein